MVRAGYFAHESPDGVTSRRGSRGSTGPARADGRWTVGENLIWSTDRLSARAAVGAWLASPGHRENLLGPFREVGISAIRALAAPGVFGHRRVVVVTVDFGARYVRLEDANLARSARLRCGPVEGE